MTVGARNSNAMKLDTIELETLSEPAFLEIANQVIELHEQDRRENAIMYYKPVSERAMSAHESQAKYVGFAGGNGSGKTESALAEAVALATGIFPEGMEGIFKAKFRGPIKVRIIVESKTTTLDAVIKEKLQWWRWTGLEPIGGERGHWGWIPKTCLLKASWQESWREKIQTLTVHCRDPEDTRRILGQSTVQFMSHSQDPQAFASGDYHLVLFDEPSRLAIFRENEARTMRVNGRIILAMTWPDEPSIPMDWLYDEWYDKATGPNKSDNHDWVELWTTDNQHLDQDSVSQQMESWSQEMVAVRIHGRPIRFSNRIHPLYTDITQNWCFFCKMPIMPVVEDETELCPVCKTRDIYEYKHCCHFDVGGSWPCIQILDPHPRKPHCLLWAVIDPADDIWVVAEAQIDDDPAEVHEKCREIEDRLGLPVATRLIDPNMGRSPASAKRNVTWQDEFDSAGLYYELADDTDVGRARVNEFLKPDDRTRRPRLHIHERCQDTNFQLKRYVWAEHKFAAEKALKQKPREKNDDFPTMLKYLMNYQPRFDYLNGGAPVIRSKGTRKGGY